MQSRVISNLFINKLFTTSYFEYDIMRLYKISVGGNYMKRLFLTGVAILLSVILLVGCQSRPINKTSLEDFEIWFDENGLDSQVNMMSYVETLTYKGKAIDCPCGAIDYVNGGGFKGETDDGTVGVEFSDFSKARERLVFEELLTMQLALLKLKNN